MRQRETVHERISETRKDKGFSQKKLCELAGITPTQLSRIESGTSETVSSDVLVKLAKALNVSSDYLLCLANISSPKNYDVSELGLSEGAVKTIISGKTDIHALNALLENAKFRELMHILMAFFMDSMAVGFRSRNEIMDFATSSLNDFIKENPDKKDEVQDGIREIRFSKTGVYEADIEKIKTLFISIVKEIKEQIGNSFNSEQPVDAEIVRKIISEVKKKKPKTVEEVSRLVAKKVKEIAHLDDENSEMFRQVVEQIVMGVGNQR